MKIRNKISTMVPAAVMTISAIFGPALPLSAQEVNQQASAANATAAQSTAEEGPIFTEITDFCDVEGSSFYYYRSSKSYETSVPVLTPVFLVYPDHSYESMDDAWEALQEMGLIEIAEEEMGAVLLVNSVGETWSITDRLVFEEIEKYIYRKGELKLTSGNMEYIICEGSGATFVTEQLTQSAKRIAGVLSFGGEYTNAPQSYALPAYIVSGSDETIEYYKTLNSVDSQEESEGKTIYINDENPVQKVVVSKTESEKIDAEIISDCWDTFFRGIVRYCLTANWYDFSDSASNVEEYILTPRPLYEEIGMNMYRHGGNPIWEDDEADFWYEFVPDEVEKAVEEGTEEQFGLILVQHGNSDHPIYEAEGNGWVALAAQENMILAVPYGRGNEEMLELIEVMKEKYPIDESRIYAVGFSAGGKETVSLTSTYPEMFAATAIMSSPSGPNFTLDTSLYDYDMDLPICVTANEFESESNDGSNLYKHIDLIPNLYEINELSFYDGEYDITSYPLWGFPLENQKRIVTETGIAYHTGYASDEEGVPLFCGIYAEDLTHVHCPDNAKIIWQWMSQFTRDTQTHEVIYTPAQ